MTLTEYTGAFAGGAADKVYQVETVHDDAGGEALRSLVLSGELFEAAAMKGVKVDLLQMKVKELQTELEVRGVPRSGSKQALRQRLRAVIIAKRLRRSARVGEGSSSED